MCRDMFGIGRRRFRDLEGGRGLGADGRSGKMEGEDQGHTPNKKADEGFECVAQQALDLCFGRLTLPFQVHSF